MSNGSKFRDFVLLFQDDINMRFGVNGTLADGGPVPFVAGAEDAEDSGMKGLNYRTEPLWFRLGIDPAAVEGVARDVRLHQRPGQQPGRRGRPADPDLHGERQSRRSGCACSSRMATAATMSSHCMAMCGSATHTPVRAPRRRALARPRSATIRFRSGGGAQEGHGPTDHWDIVPAHGAGGYFGVTGDYLFRDMAPGNFYNGVWGLLRVT